MVDAPFWTQFVDHTWDHVGDELVELSFVEHPGEPPLGGHIVENPRGDPPFEVDWGNTLGYSPCRTPSGTPLQGKPMVAPLRRAPFGEPYGGTPSVNRLGDTPSGTHMKNPTWGKPLFTAR